MIISIFIVSYNYDKNMTKCDYLQKKTIHTAKYEWSYAYSFTSPTGWRCHTWHPDQR